jgi:hypothetical protein
MPKGSLFLPQIISVLCILKVIYPSLYTAARTNKLTYAELNDLLRFNDWRDPNDPQKRFETGISTENWWRFAFGELEDDAIKEKFEKGLWRYNVEALRIISYFCEMIDGFVFPASQ